MQNAFAMSRGEARAKLARNFNSFVLRKPADAAKQRRQIFPIDILHREKRLALDFADIVDAANVGMRDATRDSDLVAKAFEQRFVMGRGIGQELEGDRLSKRQVVSAVDFAHAAFSQ